jgi:hypothetical protein
MKRTFEFLQLEVNNARKESNDTKKVMFDAVCKFPQQPHETVEQKETI